MEESESNRVAEAVNEAKMSRKEKKKMAKKKRRKDKRKEMAAKEREEEEARSKDPEERRKFEMMIKEEEEKRERALKEFEERERLWIQEMELKKKKVEEKEEERRKVMEDREKEEAAMKQLLVEKENECDEDDDWEYVEEGPAEIIWQGNEIIIRKKKVRVPKKDANPLSKKEDVDRPTSNPFPPQSEAFADHQNAQQALETVAQQVPNFGTEQDKAHCPFHLKTGACRFGQRCSRVHFYPDKSCTLLIKNMYNGPGLAWEQDEGLEYTDEEVERSYEEFYEDVHTEFLKFGEIVNFKVCRNGSSHLRGNVYVHYKSLESAVLAYRSVNGRYFAGKQITCEFINVTRWKIAICGEYMKSRLKTCSRGMACNFIHCFHNPGGDYEWADWDKPPPRYWVKKMAALFGYSDESGTWNQERSGQTRNKIDSTNADRHHYRRSRSREADRVKSGSGRSHDDERQVHETTWSRRRSNYHSESRSDEANSDGSWSDRDRDKDRDKHHGHTVKRIKHGSSMSEKSTDLLDTRDRTKEADSDGNWPDGQRDAETCHVHIRKSSRYRSRREMPNNSKNRTHVADRGQQDRCRDEERERRHLRKRSRDRSTVGYPDNHGDSCKGDDAGSIKDLSDEGIIADRHLSHKKRSSYHQGNVSKYLDEDGCGEYRSYYTDSGDDWLERDKERHHAYKRRCSRHQTEDTEFLDDEGEPINKSKKNRHHGESACDKSDPRRNTTHKHSSRRSPSRKDKSRADHKSSSSGRSDERCGSIGDQDRWRPIDGEEDGKSIRHVTSVQSYESDSPGRYSGGKSRDFDSEYYDSEKIDDDRQIEKQIRTISTTS
ncbi:zinc finger CCCH domain-containing protein 5 [Citrus clementina]|uniref:zinc finger CCCH domain-containing protein 5 n=1 Tax=Citrus clementina TaxID=85681 RepID=UPI000CED0EEA|nr:zinc finger CCCH domain-containing protein 5 [Citrus x clementina]